MTPDLLLKLGRRHQSDMRVRLSAAADDTGLEVGAIYPGPFIVKYAYAWSAEWCRSGRPTIDVDECDLPRMCTTAPEGAVAARHRFFLVVLPGERGLSLLNRANELEPIASVAVTHYPDRWSFVAFGETVEYSHWWSSTAQLRDGVDVGPLSDETLRMHAHDIETRRRLGRLVLNAAGAP